MYNRPESVNPNRRVKLFQYEFYFQLWLPPTHQNRKHNYQLCMHWQELRILEQKLGLCDPVLDWCFTIEIKDWTGLARTICAYGWWLEKWRTADSTAIWRGLLKSNIRETRHSVWNIIRPTDCFISFLREESTFKQPPTGSLNNTALQHWNEATQTTAHPANT